MRILANEKSSSAEVKMGITRFTEQFPSGIFKFRAFMTSLDGVTNCSIDQIDLTF